ncbi:MAG: hypothetical protein U0T36_04795 [Saprospiraceae bacterium]
MISTQYHFKKFLGELFAAGILVFRSNVKLTSSCMDFGIYELPEIPSDSVNSHYHCHHHYVSNLIDGITWLFWQCRGEPY